MAQNTKTILVVDDDAEVLKSVRDALVKHGFRVITAADGKACLREIIVKKPDLIVMDLMMPRMDGLSAIDVIKVMRLGNPVPILAWSGNANEQTFERARKLGADDCLSKTLTMKEFIDRVAKRLT